MVYLINMQHVLLIFWKNQACMVLLHPACFINFGKNSSLHGLLHPISSENHHSSHYFASKLTLMVKNWIEYSLKPILSIIWCHKNKYYRRPSIHIHPYQKIMQACMFITSCMFYWFWELCKPACLLHPAPLLDRP